MSGLPVLGIQFLGIETVQRVNDDEVAYQTALVSLHLTKRFAWSASLLGRIEDRRSRATAS